ncbi:hypothetical protein [Clostridium tepidiprofundi]|nr:hypothetical protein [Clostridium tepidiprofundi]
MAAKLWSDEQELHMKHMLVGKFAKQNISSMPKEGRNGGNEYVSELFEQILSRNNLNNAY